MATIWFLKDGEAQLAFPIARKPLEWCVKNIGLRPDNWRADLARKNLTIAKNSPTGLGGTYRALGCVIVEIDKDDLATSLVSKEWKQGFHLLDSDEIEASKSLSADSEFYARALRAIGQDLADLSPEKLEIEIVGDDFVARGHGRDNRLGARDADVNSLTKIWKKLVHNNRMANPGQSQLLIVPFVCTYTLADIDRLDEVGTGHRDSRNKVAADLYSLGERLRTIGRIVDANQGKLTKLFKDGNSVTFHYQDQDGQTHREELSNLALYQIQKQYYSQRGTYKAKDLWDGLDR